MKYKKSLRIDFEGLFVYEQRIRNPFYLYFEMTFGTSRRANKQLMENSQFLLLPILNPKKVRIGINVAAIHSNLEFTHDQLIELLVKDFVF